VMVDGPQQWKKFLQLRKKRHDEQVPKERNVKKRKRFSDLETARRLSLLPKQCLRKKGEKGRALPIRAQEELEKRDSKRTWRHNHARDS